MMYITRSGAAAKCTKILTSRFKGKELASADAGAATRRRDGKRKKEQTGTRYSNAVWDDFRDLGGSRRMQPLLEEHEVRWDVIVAQAQGSNSQDSDGGERGESRDTGEAGRLRNRRAGVPDRERQVARDGVHGEPHVPPPMLVRKLRTRTSYVKYALGHRKRRGGILEGFVSTGFREFLVLEDSWYFIRIYQY